MIRDLIHRKNILVVGDVMLDCYYKGEVKRISPEAPVPVFRKKSEWCVLGGAANVATNLVAAEQTVSIMTRIGKDSFGDVMMELFSKQNIGTDLVLRTQGETTVKTRFLADNNQQVMRLDVEDTSPLEEGEYQQFIEILKRRITEFNLIVISDYLKGYLTKQMTQGVIRLAHQYNIRVIVDVKDPDYSKYAGAYLLKPNQKELQMLSGMSVNTMEEIKTAADQLLKMAKVDYLLTTLGAKGMLLRGKQCEDKLIPSMAQEVFDVTGAGDTTIAYIATCLANGIEITKAMEIANIAAGLQVAKVGTSVVCIHEVDEYIMSNSVTSDCKILKRDGIEKFRNIYQHKKIVFTNGCFDILHVGHIRYLQEARKLGDMLVVGLNSDTSVKRLKGATRPINEEKDRAELLCALDCVDYVVIFEEDTPYNLILQLQPDVLVKGGDYRPDEVVGKDIVEKRGGYLKLISFVEGKSTTKIIEKMKG